MGSPCSSEMNGSAPPCGSLGNTSIAAPARCPETRCERNAAWSTTKPRLRLRNMLPVRMWDSSRSPNSWRLAGLPSTCKVTMSTDSRSSSREPHRWALPRASLSAVS